MRTLQQALPMPMASKVTSNSNGHPSLWDRVLSRLISKPCAMTWGLFEITPEAAAWILENLNFARNRNKKPFKISLMAEDIKAGRWHVTHQGIAFSEDGWLVDGQNRLQAIIDAGVPTCMVVFFEVSRDSVQVFDIGTLRNITDAAKIAGMDGVTSVKSAACTRMIQGFSPTPAQLSNPQKIAFMEEYEEAISFSAQCFGGKERGITTAPVYAVVARAWFTQDRKRVALFCSQLKSGEVSDAGDGNCSILVRNFLVKSAMQKRYGSSASVSTYRKVERGLWGFLRHERMAALYEAAEELFPLPGEEVD